MLSTSDDMTLIAEIKKRNMAAFRALYYRYIDMVYVLVAKLVGTSRLDVDDLVQEVFFQVHRSIRSFEGNSGFRTWLHRITVNVCCTQLRKRSTFGEVVDHFGTTDRLSSGDREERMDARRQLRRMFALLDEMSLENRTVFTLYELQGLTLAEIAEILDVPLHTVASRLRRSRHYLMRGIAGKCRHAEGGES